MKTEAQGGRVHVGEDLEGLLQEKALRSVDPEHRAATSGRQRRGPAVTQVAVETIEMDDRPSRIALASRLAYGADLDHVPFRGEKANDNPIA